MPKNSNDVVKKNTPTGSAPDVLRSAGFVFHPAARAMTDAVVGSPELALDLVATGVRSLTSVQMQAFFNGKPEPKLSVEVLSNSGWKTRAITDENGLVTLVLPWTATYILMMKKRCVGTMQDSKTVKRSLYLTTITLHRIEGLNSLVENSNAELSDKPTEVLGQSDNQ
jgi:hypothetical protein